MFNVIFHKEETCYFNVWQLVFLVAALYMTCVVKQIDAHQWFAELNIDLEKVSSVGSGNISICDS